MGWWIDVYPILVWLFEIDNFNILHHCLLQGERIIESDIDMFKYAWMIVSAEQLPVDNLFCFLVVL